MKIYHVTASTCACAAALFAASVAHAQQAAQEASAQSGSAAGGEGEVSSQVGASGSARQAAGEGFADIVVTARRTEERLQDVPIAITAVSGEELNRQDIRTFFDLEKKVPGLSVCCSRGGSNAFLRGIPGVVGYWAETPVTLNGSALYFDVGNAQVLKGPQGTLFGLSANAGAVLYEPQRPTTELGGYVSATVGQYNRRTLEGAINLPLLDDRVLVRLGGMSQYQDGFTYDVSQGKDVNDENYKVLRGAVELRLTDRLENRFAANYYHSNTNGTIPYPLYAVNPNGPARAIFGAYLDEIMEKQKEYGYYKVVGSGNNTYNISKQLNISNITEWEFVDDIRIRNIFGYQSSISYGTTDTDGTPVGILDGFVEGSIPSGPLSQTSEEIQLQGTTLDGNLHFTIGAFFLDSHTKRPGISYGITLGGKSGTRSNTIISTKAVYAQASYNFGDFLEGLELTGGYRYNWDSRTATQTRFNAAGTPVSDLASSAKFTAATYTAQLSYKASRNVMIYINNSKGYSSGGFNLTAPPSLQVYQPESLNNFEGGIKSNFMIGNMPVRADLSTYYGKYDDVQVQVTQSVQTPTGVQLAVVTQNAAKGHIFGQELELEISPVPGLQLSVNGALLNGKYDRWESNGEDLSGTPFLFMPKLKYSISGSYEFIDSADVGTFQIGASYSRQSKIKTNIGSELNHLYSTTPAFGTLNIHVDWDDVMGMPLQASLYWNNVTKNHWANGQLGAYNSLGAWGFAAAVPRMWGLRLRYSF